MKILGLYLVFFTFTLHSQIVLNKGQWKGDFLAKYQSDGMEVYLDHEGLLIQNIPIPNHGTNDNHTDFKLNRLKINLIGSNISRTNIEVVNQASFKYNYFNQNTPKGVSIHPSFELLVKEIYPNVDLHLIGTEHEFKYNFVLNVGAQIDDILIEYQSNNRKMESNNTLQFRDEYSIITESQFVYWYEENPNYKTIANRTWIDESTCKISLTDSDISGRIILDPILDYSTMFGGNDDNWSYSSTADSLGNMYLAGITFGSNYPTTLNAYDTIYNGGQQDIVITKLDTTATNLIFSTFIGGSESDIPGKIILSQDQYIYCLGATSSLDFPTSSGCFQNNHNGGTSSLYLGFYPPFYTNYPNGADAVIFKIDTSGSSLISSTYFGSDSTDGTVSRIYSDLSDEVRGDIIVDNENVLVLTSTKGDLYNSSSGEQDIVLAVFDTALTQLKQSIQYGSATNDLGADMELSSNGELYVCGHTEGGNPFWLATNSYMSQTDGVITKFDYNPSGPIYLTGLQSIFVGDNNENILRFISLDSSESILVAGASSGIYNGAINTNFTVSNSTQFIEKYDNNLNKLWGMSIGSGSNNTNFSLTGFDVDSLNNIYLSGACSDAYLSWLNLDINLDGLPTTYDAIENTLSYGQWGVTSGYYVVKLAPNSDSMVFASFFNGGHFLSPDHIHGSAFIENGVIYHPACAGCGGNNNEYVTTSGVVQENNYSVNCTMGAFRIDMNKPSPPDTTSNASINSSSSDLSLVTVYPNPSNGTIFIEGTNLDGFVIYNSLGQIIHEGDLTDFVNEIDFSGHSGLFHLYISDINGAISVKKIILRN